MCGIVGIIAFEEQARNQFSFLDKAVHSLDCRGPDHQDTAYFNRMALGHSRLSIIDTSTTAHQPMTDPSGRYTIVFNGEIYNFQELKQDLLNKGISFRTHSDTEVLLQQYIHEGKEALHRLNGFFSFAIYDENKDELFIARDRFGIKPLYVYEDEEKLIFASEMSAIFQFSIAKNLDYASLLQYLQLSYTPAPSTMLTNVRKILPGHWLTTSTNGTISEGVYYNLNSLKANNENANVEKLDYQKCQDQILELLEESVQKRMIADVPLGAFLSGGIDSSAIVALASKYTDHLKTFSIGYEDEPYFDESYFANLVAKHFNTDHTVFSLSNNDLYDHLFDILDYFDEPFADSSAIAVYILSKKTREEVTVALSGDGADELFAGYNKYFAEHRAQNPGLAGNLVRSFHPLWKVLPESRHNYIGNKIRQLERYAAGTKLSADNRYWRWCSLTDENEVAALLQEINDKDWQTYLKKKQQLIGDLKNDHSINDILIKDLSMVLPNDMLTKVDRMSMANSLEVRVPFLDHNLVEYVASLPSHFKLHNGQTKAILKDAFRNILPDELYTRPKHGFEVPLLKWFQHELRPYIEKEILSDDFIIEQDIFERESIQTLKKNLFSHDPGDIQAQVWSLIVFQHWWKKHMM